MTRARELADIFSGSDSNFNTSGDITADEFIGDGSQLTGVYRVPTQTGNGGKYLQTDGNATSWAEIPDDNIDGGNAATTYAVDDIVITGGGA